MNKIAPHWLTITATMMALATAGCAIDSAEEHTGQISAAQFDPGEKSYTIYTLTTDQMIVAQMLATDEAIDSYEENSEHWRFNRAGLKALENMQDIEVTSISYWQRDDAVDSMWPPSGAWFAQNDLVMPTDVLYQPLQSPASTVYEARIIEGFDIRIALDIEMNDADEASGTISFYHDAPEPPGYLFSPEMDLTLKRISAADWNESNWFEFLYASNE